MNLEPWIKVIIPFGCIAAPPSLLLLLLLPGVFRCLLPTTDPGLLVSLADVTLESRDATGNTALHHACEMGHLDTVRALMSRDVPRVRTGDVNAETITEAMLEGEYGYIHIRVLYVNMK